MIGFSDFRFDVALKKTQIIVEIHRECDECAVLSIKDMAHGNPIHVTISIGLTVADLSRGSIEEALKCSDVALYQAKKSGCNQVAVWGGEASET